MKFVMTKEENMPRVNVAFEGISIELAQELIRIALLANEQKQVEVAPYQAEFIAGDLTHDQIIEYAVKRRTKVQPIDTIKAIRAVSAMTLREAKDFYDAYEHRFA